jgi:hypothetical protein
MEQFFSFHHMLQFLQQSPALKLLRSGNAAMCVTFLYKQFREQNVISIPLQELSFHLADYLVALNYFDAEQPEPTLDILGMDYQERAMIYLNRWASEENKFILINLEEKTHEPYATLSKYTEKVFQALEILKDRDFVATESKFIDLFDKVQELVSSSISDPNIRLAELEKQKKALEAEIKSLKKGISPDVLETYQVKSRWADIHKLSQELMGDFREVEENFKEIYKHISRRHADAQLSKGQLLKLTFDALEELRNNDQGKSFYAFWEFLMNDEEQDRFAKMCDQLYEILDGHHISYEGKSLKRLKSILHAAGRKVLETNELLGFKLSRIVVEKERMNRKKTASLLQQILQIALQHSDAEKFSAKGTLLSIDHKAEIHLPLERKPGEKPVLYQYKQMPQRATLNLNEAIELQKLVEEDFIDKQKLRSNITGMLSRKNQISLREIVEHHGCAGGLPELLAYISLTGGFGDKCVVSAAHQEDICYDHIGKKYLRTPQIVFTR